MFCLYENYILNAKLTTAKNSIDENGEGFDGCVNIFLYPWKYTSKN